MDHLYFAIADESRRIRLMFDSNRNTANRGNIDSKLGGQLERRSRAPARTE